MVKLLLSGNNQIGFISHGSDDSNKENKEARRHWFDFEMFTLQMCVNDGVIGMRRAVVLGVGEGRRAKARLYWRG